MTSAVALAISVSHPVYAEEEKKAAKQPIAMLEEITVTAQKRSENVQSVPIAISAFTSSSLSERAVASVASLSNIAPNVTLDAGVPFAGSSAILAAYIRGIGQNDFAANLDPGVGVYLDGIYLARTVGANLDLPDVERVEILKGPQGTLFGRNTIGGAISVVTKDPGDEIEFSGAVTTGRFDRLDTMGYISTPLTDDLGASVTFSSRDRGGYLKRIPFPGAGAFAVDPDSGFSSSGSGSSDEEGGQNDWTLRSKVVWEPTDRLRIKVSGDYLNQDQQGTSSQVLDVTSDMPGPFGVTPDRAVITPFGPTSLYNAGSGLPPNGFNFGGLYNFCINSTAGEIAGRNATALCGPRGTPLNPGMLIGGLASVNVDADPFNDRLPFDDRYDTGDIDTSYATGDSFSRLKNWGVSSMIDFDVTDKMTLKSITGYRDIVWSSAMDMDGSPTRSFEISLELEQWQFSQEFQLTGTAMEEDRLKYVVGAYYFKEESYLVDYVNFANGLLQIEGPNDLATENYAFFGQVDYAISDLISVTVGGRYTHESKDFNGGQSDLNGFNYKLFNCPVFGEPCTTALGFPETTEPLRYHTATDQHKTFNNFSPKVGVQVYPADDMMVYASYSQGYKTGGWTTRLSNPLPMASDFDEEEAKTIELGVKSQLLDNRLQINAAVFTTKFSGIQLNFLEGVSPTFQNAGDARIKGAELELTAVPVEGLMINGSIGYIDAYYTSVEADALVPTNPIQAGVFEGAPLPKTPSWKINISPRYEMMLGNNGSMIFLVDYTYTSSVWNDTERTFALKRPATHMMNASVKYVEPNEHWDVTVGVTNLLDDRYLTTGTNQTTGGIIQGAYNSPMEWYARVGVQF